MKVALFHPLLPVNQWFYALSDALNIQIESFTDIYALEKTTIDAVIWYADIPFDYVLYDRLIRKCSTIIWFLPHTTAYRFRVGAQTHEPVFPFVANLDIEEMKTIFPIKYPHLFHL